MLRDPTEPERLEEAFDREELAVDLGEFDRVDVAEREEEARADDVERDVVERAPLPRDAEAALRELEDALREPELERELDPALDRDDLRESPTRSMEFVEREFLEELCNQESFDESNLPLREV